MHSNDRSNLHPTLTCDICGFESARIRHIPRSYGKGNKLLVIENVPVINCPNCGESYISAKTAKTIDLLRQTEPIEKRSLPVALFS